MAELLTVGETMAVMVPQGAGPLRYQTQFGVRVAGAESNTAVGAAKLGHSSAWISKLGADELGQRILLALRGEGVDCGGVRFDETRRTGLMFKELGGPETKVYYYRENSAASHMTDADVPAEAVENAGILHLTGITPVLGKECEGLVRYLAELARRKGTPVSFDPNIRRRLWKDRDYRPLIRELVMNAQIVLMGLPEAELLFGTSDRERIRDKLFGSGSAGYLALKEGERGAWVADERTALQIPPYPCRPVDAVGAGDAFNAGFLCGVLEGRTLEECGRMGGIAGALATETCGDYEGYPDREKMCGLLQNREEVYR